MMVRMECRPAFSVVGAKTWISGQDNEQFGRFWAEANASGLIARLHALPKNGTPVIDGGVYGVSCVEKDPMNRAFDFLIAVEAAADALPDGLEHRDIPACTWAVFAGEGELPMSLVRAEMYAFMEWLPSSGYRHAAAPELEVYPAPGKVEFWLPVVEK